MSCRRFAVIVLASLGLLGTPVLERQAAVAAPVKTEPSVASVPVPSVARETGAEDIVRPVPTRSVVWPVAGTGRVGDLSIETLDPAAVARLGGIGLGVRVSRVDKRTDAKASITLDYSGFAHAYGAGFAGRLQVLGLPGRQRVPARNDLAAKRMTLEVTPDPGVTYILAAAAGGSFSGNFGATDLAPTGTWQTGLSSGSFSYQYPIPLPASPHGRGPELSFQYNSSAVDGMTSATNAQAGWTGLGWQLNPGYIERRFRPCAEDAAGSGKKSKQRDWGHLCWESPDENDGQAETTDATNSELFLSLNGRSTRIVKDRLTGTWKTQDDFGWRVELNAAAGHWLVTTQSGDVYRFGGRRDSAWQVPYAGDDPGEPCNAQYSNGGRDYPGMCTAPWRWNLDQIVDANENLTTFYWKREAGKYLYHADEICCGIPPTYSYTPIDYDRGGYLDYVEWGANTTITGSRPTSKVVFNMVSRCSSTTTRDDPLANPYPIDTGTGNLTCLLADWDVPDDLATCNSSQCNAGSPAFFIMRRLDSVVTYSYDSVTGVWDDVHKLQLRFKYVRSSEAGSNGCCTPALWLDYIRPVGVAGSGEIRLPAIDFDAVELNGRVDYGMDFFLTKPRAILPRIATVHNGFGGRVEVTYGRPNPCPDGGAEASGYYDWYNSVQWDRGTQDCFRVYDFWFPFGSGPEALYGVYHKYLVTKVVERDAVGGSPPVETAYEYQGTPAWAKPVNYLGTRITAGPSNTLVETATWSEARGYGTVRTLKGSGTDPAGYSVTTDTFFRGMYDDVFANGTKKLSRVSDFDGAGPAGGWEDYLVQVGRPLQTRRWTMTAYSSNPAQRTYAEAESTRQEYARVVSGDGPGVLDPARVDEVRARTRDLRSDGTWRYTDRRTTYDAYGLPSRENDYGEDGVATDNTCLATTYARSLTLWMISYPSTKEERAGDSCDSGTVTGRTNLVYDNATEPSDGNVTEERRWLDGARTAISLTGYDDYGRVTSTTDPLGRVTATAYTPSVGWPESGVTTTDPAGHQTTVRHSRLHGQPTWTRDPQGRVTEIDYDQLGRKTALWGAGQARAGGIPSSRITYTLTYNGTIGQPTAPSKTQTEKLLSGTSSAAKWQTAITYDDGFGRVREAQSPAPGGGRIVVASVYDARGKLSANSAPVHNSSAPGSGLHNATLTTLPLWTRYQRDGGERTQAAVQFSFAGETRRMGADYRGEDVVSVNPATGGAVEYRFDAQDRVTRVLEWVFWGVAQETRYEYDTDGRVTRIVDAKGNVRTFGYDWEGRVISRTDPDSGTTTSTFDLAGQLTSTVDGRGQKVSYVYDSLGRKSEQWAGDPVTGTKLAEWTYDTVVKGQLSTATRWVGGNGYRYDVTSYDPDNRPTGTRLTVPAAESGLAGTYEFTAAYNAAGQKIQAGLPAIPAAGLAAETMTLSYTDEGQAKALTSDFGGSSVYVKDSLYTKTGKLSERSYGPQGQVVRRLTWDQASDRLQNVATLSSGTKVQDDDYYYDANNNVSRIADKTAIVNGQLGVQSECFINDSTNRLVFAWTTTKPDCSDGWFNSPDNLGPDPYWRGFTYDEVGNLTSVDTGGRKADYTYAAPGSARPNAVASIVYPDRTDTFGYDDAGRMTSRTVAGQSTTLAWNELGQLSRTTFNGQATDYVYGADGERLIRREPGASTLYLGDMEVRAAGGAVSARRYYVAGDGVVAAVRNSSPQSLMWLAADPQRSEQIAIDAASGRVDRQRYLPFGGHRGGRDDITATERGFLGKHEDGATGLVLLDARYYDPAIGRFVSPDPALDMRTPQWMNTYAYAGNNPVSRMDPTGLASCTNPQGKNCRAIEFRQEQIQKAKWQQQCWYQGKNCDKLPKAERVPPWKRHAPKARTVKEALYALADAIASSKFSDAAFKACQATMVDVGGRCAKAAAEMRKVFNRAAVDAFCGHHKALCASAAPDYISLGFALGKWGLSGGMSITVTRTGQVYISTEAGVAAGVDVKGLSVSIKVGWVYGPGNRRADDKAVSGYPSGAGVSLSGTIPFVNELWGISATDSNYALERGVAFPGISLGRSYGYWAGSFGPIWTI